MATYIPAQVITVQGLGDPSTLHVISVMAKRQVGLALALFGNLHGIRDNEFIRMHGNLCWCLWRSEDLLFQS